MLKSGLSRGDALSQARANQNSNVNLRGRSFAYKVWKIKHRLIVESINKTGDFDLREINRKAKELAELVE